MTTTTQETENFDSKAYLDMELLRFSTAGSVDDGKSTLIGRLLYDSKSIFQDQIEAIEAASAKRGEEYVNLALLTDGLRAEREQGITIDVAYRYFSTPKRKFIIADTPGHIQYTRNMVTGASTANLAIILVDARKGIIEQTYRHSYIASLLQIPHITVCINKMDLVDWDEKIFNQIVHDYKAFASKLDIKDVHFIPISALAGDNVVNRSQNMNWYNGPTLMYLLETIHIGSDLNHIDARFPVQYVVRPMKNEYHDFRGYAGRIAGGVFRVGDKVKALPSGFSSKIKSIVTMDAELQEAFAPQSVTITLEDEIDISRGDMIVRENNVPQIEQEFDVMLCWMNEKKMVARGKYIIRHTSKECKCIVKEAKYKLDINTLQRIEDDVEIGLNDIGRVTLRTTVPLFFDSYRKNRITGSIILVDEATNETVAAGMMV
ncbi:MAG TPA: sulfate adenylyltransferase subunit CysN [Chitinophagales bacterium]|nr:sulfate adenylyltransferase subunit CysN [Chitinophagales bacterium]HMW13706.1 sulfate adenylyltransferase subunit CysN [Chitinophagales bacterium]HMX60570.1 sulfate adenylyltransferase subunit CysN [Chitinophagales bacterium]HMZ33981.1 sulfate adenylyltransferase subunit CysN [Chitinophagales bacterium]HNC72925.1 sulfate adenylyltransferase subunit CysN [Chitinophagales bacterium]